MNILVLGVTGMLGNALFKVFSENKGLDVYGMARNSSLLCHFPEKLTKRITIGLNVENCDSLVKILTAIRPDVVVNCIGIVKQLPSARDPMQAVPINTLLPHRLAALCQIVGARLIHFSTDCVFSGATGGYVESSFPDADDLYGRTKLLGEVDYPHAVTVRTSIIGHQLSEKTSLVGWFLGQKGHVQGFTKAVFSGLPTVEIAHVVKDFILPHRELHGIYHVAAKPINKFDLLKLIAATYGKAIEIIPSDELVIDRSLNADRFNRTTGYVPPEWPALVQRMYEFK
jgi:dTDP-4-dehydrorhamnose reductase